MFTEDTSGSVFPPWLEACAVHPSLLQLSVQLCELHCALASYLHNYVGSLPMRSQPSWVFPKLTICKQALELGKVLKGCDS